MMKKLLRWCVPALIFSLLLLGCRNEDFTGQYVNSKREEAFFREALSKTSRLRNNKTIIEALKKQNERSHFVSKMKDQSGLPVWDKMLAFKKPKTANRGEDGGTAEEYVIPLTEDKENLSSILYITRYPDGTFAFNNIDNADVKQTVNDNQIDKSYREQLLSNFIVIDHLTFPTDAVYWNLPDDLFASIPESQTYAERRFRINIKDSETGGTTNKLENAYMYCYEVVLDDPTCGCHGTTPTTVCTVVVGSGGGDTGGTEDTGGGTTTGDPGGGGGGGGSPTGDPGSNTDCNSPNKAFYKIVPGCDDDDSLPTQVKTLKNKLLSINSNNDISEYTYFLSSYPSTAQVFANFLNQNYNQKGADIVMSSIKFWFTYPDTLNPDQLPARINNLNNLLIQNPDALLDITCAELQQWQDVSKYQIPQSVKNKLNSIPNQNSYWSSWEITDLESGAGARVNMDLFPVKITTMPNKPNGQKYASAEFFDFFRKNINLFAEKFTPIEDNNYNIHDTALWNSSNPLGALIHIEIPGDDGTVICSGFSSNTWIFTTIKAPLEWSYDGIHPVAGNRKFSYYTDPNDGSITIYTRGVDRLSNVVNNETPLLNFLMESYAFHKADKLWEDMQTKLSNYINSNGGVCSKVTPKKFRPKYEGIEDYLKGKSSLNTFTCH